MLPLLLALAAAPPAPVPAAPAPLQERQGDPNAYPRRANFAACLAHANVGAPEELFDVLRVVDGDTIWIEREGERVKLRLLSLDTEEKWMESGGVSASKPSTRYGDVATGWVQGFFTPRTPDAGPVRVGLRFPDGDERFDVYGRLLCHVITEEGIDFNLLAVRLGLSPYFNKYGNSRIDHAAFAEAQRLARREKRGVWSPETNEGGARRPYARLLPWWDARAEALDAFRAQAADAPLKFVEADAPDALQAALDAGGTGVTVLALVDRFFDEDDGSRTVLLRSGDRRRAVRVHIQPEDFAAMEEVDLEGSMADFRQNYLLVTGDLVQGERGFDLRGVEPSDWRRAGPEPVVPDGPEGEGDGRGR